MSLDVFISTLPSTFFLTFLFLFLVFCKLFSSITQSRPKKLFPPTPWKLPIIGHMHHLAPYHDNPWEGFSALMRKLGNVYFVQMGVRKMVVVSSMEPIKEVLLTKGEIFVDRPDFQRYHTIFDGDRENALALCDWSKTQRMRRLVAQMVVLPRFGSQLFSQLNNVIQSHMDELVEIKMKEFSDKKGSILSKSDVLFWCGNIFSEYLCSKRFAFRDAGYDEAIFNYDYIFWDINQSYAFDFIPWLTTYLRVGSSYLKTLSDACMKVRNYVGDSVINPRLQRYIEEHGLDRDKVTHGQNGSSEQSAKEFDEEDILKSRTDKDMTGKDFLDVSLEYHFRYKDYYPWHVAVFEVLDLIGGHSAAGNLLMRVLGHLALDQEAQDVVYREGQEVLRKTGRNLINLNDRQSMPFTEATIMEGLRLASSPIIPHVATQDTTLSGYTIEKGTYVLFNSYHLNMSEKYWKDPKSFNPRRFLVKTGSENSTESSPTTVNNNESEVTYKILKPDYFMPFSFGRRACLGYKLVNSVCFSMIGNLCQKFTLSVGDGQEQVLTQNLLRPKGSLALPVDQDGKCYVIRLTPRRQ